jgi:hypothetical protein
MPSPLGSRPQYPDTVLYNSLFRADDEMLVDPQVHGIAAAYAPHDRHDRTRALPRIRALIEAVERGSAGAAAQLQLAQVHATGTRPSGIARTASTLEPSADLDSDAKDVPRSCRFRAAGRVDPRGSAER